MLDSSAGFTLDTGTMLSPDANWIAWENRDALSPDDRRGFARICPDFVVALLSPTDRLTDTMRKMEHWLMAGTKLGWLIAPGTESVYVFEAGPPVRPVGGFDQELVADPVEFFRCHAGSDTAADGLDGLRCDAPRLADQLDLRGRVDVGAGEPRRSGVPDVLGPWDPGRDGTDGGNRTC